MANLVKSTFIFCIVLNNFQTRIYIFTSVRAVPVNGQCVTSITSFEGSVNCFLERFTGVI